MPRDTCLSRMKATTFPSALLLDWAGAVVNREPGPIHGEGSICVNRPDSLAE
jgi:hypothetical protein